MYIVVVGAGKVGWNLARELIGKGNEVTVIESDASRFAMVEEELEHAVHYGDGSELWVLERAGVEGQHTRPREQLDVLLPPPFVRPEESVLA